LISVTQCNRQERGRRSIIGYRYVCHCCHTRYLYSAYHVLYCCAFTACWPCSAYLLINARQQCSQKWQKTI